MPFDSLRPQITGNLPELYHAIPIQRPEVFDTEKLLHPLLALSDYLSPLKQAQRKAEIAKAGYEHWLYSKGAGGTQAPAAQLWYFNNQKRIMDLRKSQSALELNKARLNVLQNKGTINDPHRLDASGGQLNTSGQGAGIVDAMYGDTGTDVNDEGQSLPNEMDL